MSTLPSRNVPRATDRIFSAISDFDMNSLKKSVSNPSYPHVDEFVEKPLYAMGKTQAYLLSLVAPTREIILVKPYNQVVEERLYADIRRPSRREQWSGFCRQ
ncbi:hypothetical protein Aduo_004656 [Ancylostoma duodenale]